MAVDFATRPATTERETQWTPPPQGEWTYEDYRRLPDNGFRYEVIEGELYMTPAPRPKHQWIALKFAIALSAFVEERLLGRIYIAPIDVYLAGRATPVQPDVLFINTENLNIVKENAIEGVPDLIVEVLSPSNPDHDRQTKFRIYAEAGVREYWIVDPDACTLDVYVLRGNAYALLGKFESEDESRSEVLPGFSVQVGELCVEIT